MVAKLKCKKHDIIWNTGQFYGVFPPKERGVCKICGKQFVRIKKKGGDGDDKNKTNAG